eukprot:7391996-Prymnesium_polylepis.1
MGHCAFACVSGSTLALVRAFQPLFSRFPAFPRQSAIPQRKSPQPAGAQIHRPNFPIFESWSCAGQPDRLPRRRPFLCTAAQKMRAAPQNLDRYEPDPALMMRASRGAPRNLPPPASRRLPPPCLSTPSSTPELHSSPAKPFVRKAQSVYQTRAHQRRQHDWDPRSWSGCADPCTSTIRNSAGLTSIRLRRGGTLDTDQRVASLRAREMFFLSVLLPRQALWSVELRAMTARFLNPGVMPFIGINA